MIFWPVLVDTCTVYCYVERTLGDVTSMMSLEGGMLVLFCLSFVELFDPLLEFCWCEG